MNLPRFNPAYRRKIGWLVLATATCSYALLALAEQGTGERTVDSVPPGPLPFAREQLFGLDLRGMSSLAALNWLNSTSGETPALVALPVDGDVVSALGQDAARPNAFAALDALIGAARGAPVALCLRKPPQTVGDLGVAQAAVGAVLERYTGSVAYVSSCELETDRSWQRAVTRAVLPEAEPPVGVDRAFIPLSAGTIAVLAGPVGVTDIGDLDISSFATSRYVIEQVEARAPLDVDTIDAARRAIRDVPQLAVLLVAPDESLDPTTMLTSLRSVALGDTVLPQGFTAATSTMVQRSAEWQPSTVGTASYARSTAAGASMTVEFVGTELYLTGILSPDAGRLSVWVDADSSGGNTRPFSIVSLAADQARDDAIPLVSDLPAAQHRLTIVVEGGAVTVSGFFAAGKAEPGTTSALVAIGLFAIAVVALADICYASVTELRNRALAPDRSVSAQDHPREFTHRR